MKNPRIILICCFLALMNSVALAHQVAAKNYKVGDVEKFSMEVNAQTSFGEIIQKSKLIQKVVKVYENGDADIEASNVDGVVTMGGQEMQTPEMPAMTMRVNKFGVPVQSDASKKSLSIDPSQLGILGLDKVKDLVVGKEIPIDEKSATGTVKGKAKILEIDKDVLKVATDVEVTSDKTGTPMHLKTVAQIDYAKSQINRVDGEILSGLPEQGGVTIDSLKFTMIRIN